MQFLSEKIAGLDLLTLGIAGLTKYAEERALTPLIGNASFMSGAVKIAAALVIQGTAKENKYAKAVALGFGVDGVEDLITAGLNMVGFGANGGNQGGLI